MKKLIVLLALVALTSASAVAATIAYTGFEEPATSTTYKNTEVMEEPGYLSNDYGWTTNYAGGTELGFQTYWDGTDGPCASNETTGDFLGVTDYSNYDGDGSFEAEDVDSFVRLEVDSVDITNWHDVEVSCQLKVLAKYGAEAGDIIYIYALVDGTTKIEIFQMEGDDLDTYYAENGYNYVEYSCIVPNSASTVQFMAELTSDASQEGFQIDDVYITGEEGGSTDPVCVAVDEDLTGDCVVNTDDIAELAGAWVTDGYDSPALDPNYVQHVGFDWADANNFTTMIETYEDGTAVNEPNDTDSGRVVKLVQGDEDLDSSDEPYSSKFYLARIEGLEDGDKIYATVKMRSGQSDRWVSMFADHIRYGAYAGDAMYKNITSWPEWDTYTAEYTFDVGDTSTYDPRTGMRIAFAGECSYGDTFAEGDVLAYVDEITVSCPYREDGGEPTITVEFPPLIDGSVNYGYTVDPSTLPEICVENPAEDLNGDCYVNLLDFADVAAQWLYCGWDPATECP